MATTNELASMVAGGIPFLIQPPIPAPLVGMNPLTFRHLVGLYRFPTEPPPVSGERPVVFALIYRPVERELFVRAWIENSFGVVQEPTLLLTSEVTLLDDAARVMAHVDATSDPVGTEYVDFTIPVVLAISHAYRLRFWLRDSDGRVYFKDTVFSVTR